MPGASLEARPPRSQVCGFPAARLRGRHDWGPPGCSYAARTVRTYAVKWREPDGQTFVGRLALGPRTLCLDGRRLGAGEPPVNRQFGYEQLRSLRMGRGADRLDGRAALVVERPEGAYLVAGAGMGAPIIQELVDRLADATRAAETLRLTRSRSVPRPG
jgi:hypothetical protein